MHQIRELRLMNWKYASFFPWSFPAFSFVAQSQLNCMLTTLVEHLLLTMKIKHSHMYVMSFCFVNSSSLPSHHDEFQTAVKKFLRRGFDF